VVTLRRAGDVCTGRFAFDFYDLSGKLVNHVEGDLKAERSDPD
jgi:hypothetical protein